MSEWGELIHWTTMRDLPLDDDTPVMLNGGDKLKYSWLTFNGIIIWYRLPADHAYYTVLWQNCRYGTKYKYWPGGESAPSDWNGGAVLFRNGRISINTVKTGWTHLPDDKHNDIIGYIPTAHPKPSKTIDGIPYSDVLYILDAVRDNDMEKARSYLPVDPVLARAREIHAKHCNSTVTDDAPVMQAIMEALRDGMGS